MRGRKLPPDLRSRGEGLLTRAARPPGSPFPREINLEKELHSNRRQEFISRSFCLPHGRRVAFRSVSLFGALGSKRVPSLACVSPVSLPRTTVETVPGSPLLRGLTFLLFPMTPAAFSIFRGSFRLTTCAPCVEIFFLGHRIHSRRRKNVFTGCTSTRPK